MARVGATHYGRLAPTYDTDTDVGGPLRQQVVAKLDLTPADVVLDVGCGTGLCFSLIQERIGAEGHLIGIDADSEMLRIAQRRVEASGWGNVSFVHAEAEKADILVTATAALFCLTHDVMRSVSCLENILRHLVPGGRVAAGGVKWAPCWLTPVNAFVWWLNRPYVTEFEDFDRPWENLAALVPSLEVVSLPDYLHAAYVAWGHVGENDNGRVARRGRVRNGGRTREGVRSKVARQPSHQVVTS
jgi:ubiquinone/menaquinone biosynthesis C-methylase UbiE